MTRCPFCGGTDLKVVRDDVAYLSGAAWIVLCLCGACGPNQSDKESAVMAWNQRND